MRDLVETLSDISLVMYHEVRRDEHVVLLSKDGAYSVCVMQPKRRIAQSPNYAAGGVGLLTGPLNDQGLGELLQWVDQKDAIGRFRALAQLPENVVTLFP
jgi:hypothetical protein